MLHYSIDTKRKTISICKLKKRYSIDSTKYKIISLIDNLLIEDDDYQCFIYNPIIL